MKYEEYIKEALKETLTIYGPDAYGHIEEFREFFEDATILSAMRGETKQVFSSAGDTPTNNIRQALIGSGINKKGQLPMGRSFLTKQLEDDEMQNIIDEYLDAKIQNLIDVIKGSEKEYGVNKYLRENPNSDPNAFQMVDLFTTYNNLVACGRTPPEDIKADLDNMFSQRKRNFIENGIGTDNVAYRMCEFCYKPQSLDDYPLPAVTIAAMRKIASLDLYSRQQERDGKLLFDNVAEVEEVRNYLNASNIVKPNFLKKFEDDLEQIYGMAKDNKEKNNEKNKESQR